MRSTASRFGGIPVNRTRCATGSIMSIGRWGKRLIAKASWVSFCSGRSGTDFAFRTIAEAYRMIDTTMVPVIIRGDETASVNVARLGETWALIRQSCPGLANYMVQIPVRAREALRANGKGEFAAPGLRGEQFFVLTEGSLYRKESGLGGKAPTNWPMRPII